jgi:hypothetical protein
MDPAELMLRMLPTLVHDKTLRALPNDSRLP